jgi:hypothetical protein
MSFDSRPCPIYQGDDPYVVGKLKTIKHVSGINVATPQRDRPKKKNTTKKTSPDASIALNKALSEVGERAVVAATKKTPKITVTTPANPAHVRERSATTRERMAPTHAKSTG